MSKEYKNFERTMAQLLKVPHSEIKAKLEAEKKEKAQRKKRKTKRVDGSMKALVLFLILVFSSVAAAKPRDWKPATVAEITSEDTEIDKPNYKTGQPFVILTTTILVRLETPDTTYIVRQIIRRNGHPLNVTLHGQTKICVDGHDMHVLDDEGKDVKLSIVQKIAKP